MRDDPMQLSILPPQPHQEQTCYTCRYFAELKEPWVRSDEACIFGYCFERGDKNYSYNMGKGIAVFIADGRCKDWARRKEKKEAPAIGDRKEGSG